jgi:hypothetical protein
MTAMVEEIPFVGHGPGGISRHAEESGIGLPN